MAYRQLTQDQRYLIAHHKRLGKSIRAIALILDRAPSTISRELRRNRTTGDGVYRVEKAHSYATARRRRCRRGSRFQGVMAKTGRKRYRSRPARGILHGKRHISERPACVNDRSRIGDWEGDTVMGKDSKHCLLTLVERKSGFTLIRILPDRTTRAVTDAALAVIRRSEHTFNTITFDNGTEFHDYKALEHPNGPICYFATPYHSWERGTNENTNGLIRQYLPKGKCLANLTQAQCDWIADQLNQRPRKRFAFQTPETIYRKSERSVALAS